MYRIIALSVITLFLSGCGSNVRRDYGSGSYVPGDKNSDTFQQHSIWWQKHPTTPIGICANIIGRDDKWELDLPLEQSDVDDGSQALLLPSYQEAVKIAEQHCPTK